MKTAVILSVALVALGGGASRAQGADSASPAQENKEDAGKADDMAMMAVPGIMTPESLAATTRYARDSAAALQQITGQLSASPAVQERVRTRFREELPGQHPDIGEIVGLSPQQVDRLFDLLTQQNADARREATEGSTRTPEDRMKADEAKQASLLGSKYPKWQEYRASLPARLQVRDLGAALIAYDLALADEKVEPLISALAVVQKQIGPGAGLAIEESQRKLLDAAAAYLSAQQIEVYQKVLERQASRARTPAK